MQNSLFRIAILIMLSAAALALRQSAFKSWKPVTLAAGCLLGLGFMQGPFMPSSFAADQSIFVGKYSDPFHPGCLRAISAESKDITITGSDDPKASSIWKIQAREEEPGKILVDFRPKGGPANLLGVYETSDNGIHWPDGNVWKKL